jgi:WD40 repeat protein
MKAIHMRHKLLRIVLLAAAILFVPPVRAADDPYGDPIPEGAKARLGTGRMRFVYGGPTAMTPDGRFLVGQAASGDTLYYEPATGNVARAIKVQADFSTAVAFSADGTRCVNSSFDACYVWETASGKVVAKVARSFPGGDNGIAISADGKRLAIGGSRRDKDKETTAVVWDVENKKAIATITPVQNETVYVAISPDGKRLATWGYHFDRNAKEPPKPEVDPARQVQFWDADAGKELAKVHIPGFSPSMVVFSPDGTLAAASGGEGAVYLFDPATGASKGLLLGRSRQGRKLAFSPDGKTIASGGDDGAIQRWSLADGKRLGTTEPPVPMSFGLRGLMFAGNDRIVTWASRGLVPFVWETPSGKLLSPAGGHTGTITSAAVFNNQEVITAAADGQILRWNPATGKELGAIALKSPGASGVSYAPAATLSVDGTRALVSESGGLSVFDLPSGTQAFAIPGDVSRESRGAFSADGSRIVQVLGSYDVKKVPARVIVWDVAAARKLGAIELPGTAFPLAVVTPDAKTLITSGIKQEAESDKSAYTVTAWELAGGKKLGEFSEQGGFSRGYMAPLADNRSVVVTTPKGPVIVLDAKTGKKTRELEVPRGETSAPPAISPVGKTAAILIVSGYGATATGKVILVDLQSGKAKKTLEGLVGSPTTAVFSPDGKLLIAGSNDTTALVWDVSK